MILYYYNGALCSGSIFVSPHKSRIAHQTQYELYISIRLEGFRVAGSAQSIKPLPHYGARIVISNAILLNYILYRT